MKFLPKSTWGWSNTSRREGLLAQAWPRKRVGGGGVRADVGLIMPGGSSVCGQSLRVSVGPILPNALGEVTSEGC